MNAAKNIAASAQRKPFRDENVKIDGVIVFSYTN